MIVFGGDDGSTMNTGGQFDPAANSWTTITTTNAPSKRYLHKSIWTGSKMIVFGGTSNGGTTGSLNSGAIYDPSANSWTTLSLTNAPSRRFYHSSVWTGSKMLVFGGVTSGLFGSAVNTGASFDPSTNTWTTLSTTGAPSSRYYHTAVWTGLKMVTFGGISTSGSGSYFNTGGIYDPLTNTWTTTSTTGAPRYRGYHTTAWTGSQMLIFAGYDGRNYLNTGGAFDPVANSWLTISTTNAPTRRVYHSGTWIGSRYIVFGGDDGSDTLNTGGSYIP